MGEVIPFPIQIRETDYWQFYELWAPDGYWSSCTDCQRTECWHSGCGFVGCEYHTKNPAPPAPYEYDPEKRINGGKRS